MADRDPHNLAALVAHGPDPLLEVDRDGVVLASHGLADPPARLADRLVVDDALLCRLVAPPPEGLDREVAGRDGGRVLVRAVPHPTRPDGAVLALRDVTERAALADEVEAARRMAAVARLAGSIAHELNNPLTVLQLRTDLLLEDGVPAALRDQVRVLRDCAARVARTVRTLQRIGRPVVGQTEWVGVDQLVSAAVDAVQGRSAPGGSWAGAGRVQVDPAPPVGVCGDPDALALALEQLVALGCDPNGGRIKVTLADGWVRIDVHADHARWPAGRIEDPEAAATDRMPALGLSLAATVAHEHGGQVHGFHSPPRGGVLRLQLPLAGRPAIGRVGPARRVRVLVVDDDPLVAAVVAEWGRRGGHVVEVATDSARARDRLTRDPTFDVVLAAGPALHPWLVEAHPALAWRFAVVGGADPGPPIPHLARPFTRVKLGMLLDRLLSG